MRKLLLFACVAISASSVAQEVRTLDFTLNNVQDKATKIYSSPGTANKTTATGDTLSYATQAQTSGPYTNLVFDFTAPFDSGRLYGTNIAGLKGFAQLYDLDFDMAAPLDTTISIIGVVSRWAGTVQTASTKTVNINVWKRGTTKTAITGMPKWFIYGAPLATPAVTKSVPITGLNIGTGSFVTYFTTPLSNIDYGVYVGYTMTYNWASLAGDTIGLTTTQTAATNYYNIEAGTLDTLLDVNNLVQDAGGVWRSTRYDLGVGNAGDQVIYPMIRMTCPTCYPTSVRGVTRNNLTFYGNYPNPAVNSTNIKFSLKKDATVDIRIMDVTGKLINTISKNLNRGENIVNVETSSLATGNYVYIIETSEGDGIASQFTVSK